MIRCKNISSYPNSNNNNNNSEGNTNGNNKNLQQVIIEDNTF